ncbi:hypothetical protein [Brevundimonas sp. R86498]|uniref:hypothetical protein n=1 Tax=Brevundimonas sp. R86498 TaxID=3093845 RepID=UPI0037C63B7E
MSIASIALVAVLALPSGLQDRDALQAGLADALGADSPSDVRVIMIGRPEGPGRLDPDGDGIVTRDEFVAPTGAAFDRLDTDRDGRLTRAELAAASGPDLNGPGVHVMRLDGRGAGGPAGDGRVFMFRHGGEDGPGRDGPGRPRVEIHRMGGPEGHRGLDADRDGKVSEAEFLATLRDVFRRLDKDADGALSGDENVSDTPPPPPAAR